MPQRKEGSMAYSIKELREKEGWSQAQLAAMLGVAPSTVYNWESNKVEPRLSQFKHLSLLFQVSMDDIVIPADDATKKLLAA
jgi:transcriptional regulator with XRE-family HTH domain